MVVTTSAIVYRHGLYDCVVLDRTGFSSGEWLSQVVLSAMGAVVVLTVVTTSASNRSHRPFCPCGTGSLCLSIRDTGLAVL